MSRALEEALRTSTILGWDFIEQSTSPIMTSTTSMANNNTIDLMSSVRFASVNNSHRFVELRANNPQVGVGDSIIFSL